MSTVVTIDSTALELEAGKAYLFADNSGVETLYKYQLASGTTGNINTGVLTALGVDVDSLPVIVYQADLLNCLNEIISSVDGVTVAHSNKAAASVEYVKRSVSTKLDKSEYLTKTAVIEQKISDLETNGGGSGGTTVVESGITEVYNTVDTSASLSVEDGKCYRFQQPLTQLTVTNVARGLKGSSIMFVCANNTTVVSDVTQVVIGASNIYNSAEQYSWSIPATSLVATGTDRVFTKSFEGPEPGTDEGIRSETASWVYTCSFNTANNRWEIYGTCTFNVGSEDEGTLEEVVIEGLFAYGDDGVTDIASVAWSFDQGAELLPAGHGNMSDPYVTNISDEQVVSNGPSIQFPGTVNRDKSSASFVAGGAYCVNIWNNLMTIVEVELGTEGI